MQTDPVATEMTVHSGALSTWNTVALANSEAPMTGSTPWHDLGVSSHGLHVYNEDAHLLDAVNQFVESGLAAGEAVVVIATPSHRAQLDARLQAQGGDVTTVYTQGQYVWLDAAETLAQCLVDGCLDAQRFMDVVGGVIARLKSRYTQVHAFEEMGTLLWSAGHLETVLQLETLWNDLVRRQPCSLLCAYPLRNFARADHAEPLLMLCAAHALPTASYPVLASPDVCLRTIVALQQQAQALATERRHRRVLEQVLRRHEQELVDCFDQAPVGVHWVAPDGIILRANKAALCLLGYSADEYLGHHIAEFHVDPPVLADILRRLQAGEELQDYEARMVCKDGTLKHVLFDSSVQWEDGECIQTRCFIRDVTEHSQALETRERLAAIVDSSDDAIVGHTLDGTITSWNQGAERLYGYTAAEVLGQPLSVLVPPNVSDSFLHMLTRLQRGEHIDHYETQRQRKDGTLLDVSLTLSPIHNSMGQVIGASKIARNITVRRKAEAAQRFLTNASTLLASLDPVTQLADLVRLLVPTLADWCCIDLLQDDGQLHRLAVLHADPAKAALAEQLQRQYPCLSPDSPHTLTRVLHTKQVWVDPAPSPARLRDEARDTGHWDLLQALGFQGEMVLPLVARGRALGTLTCVLSDTTRSYSPTDVALATDLAHRAALALDNAQLYQTALTSQRALQEAQVILEQRVAERTAALKREMAEHQHTEAQLRQQQAVLYQHEKLAAMSTMLASVAHELNNPLSVIMMEAELLQEASPGDTQVEPVAAIAQAAERAMRIVRNFLTLARQHPLERQAVALNTVVQGAMELLAYALEVDSITVTWQLAPDLPLLWADPHQLHQVMLNVLTNAHHAMREVPGSRGLTLTTHYDPAQDRVLLEIRDTGPGVPGALQEQIFEPFFTTKPAGVGTGLGLPLCKGIVEAHGGAIWLESQPGLGTCLHIALPVSVARRVSQASPPRDAPRPRYNAPKTILLVDDEPGILRALTQVFRRDGHTVDTAANGRLALTKLHTQAYDLIMSDLRMPDLDGPALYQALEQQFPHMLARIIFLTGDTLSLEARTFLEHTGVPRLTKPCGVAAVRQLVTQVLQHADTET